MAELSLEQKRAVALARARRRRRERGGAQSRAAGLVDSFTHGATMGFGDELTGLESAVLGRTPEGGWFDYSRPFGERYDRAVSAERDQQDRFAEENPITSTVAEIGGAVATGSGLAGKGLTFMRPTTSRAGTIAGGAAEGAAYGAVSGAGNADNGDRLAGAKTGAALGAALGGGISGAVDSVGRAMAGRAASRAAPSSEKLSADVDAMFRNARAENVRFKDFKPFSQDLTRTLADEGLDRTLHPDVTAALARMRELEGVTPKYKALEIRRRIFSGAAKSTKPD